ncbi:ATP-dependent Clp protease adapter ClpS [Leucobacter denitrificans]|uniref:ATP-dependent Clp protease adapter protein ClpS n=2 Tax=Leucobacter denitrificans TaxID=683042 RepID=A0A7G9S7H8_9MICO|nr:ATP-dependent Clp protease adapter ClpS [Leucobacter denitrificans]QNN63803.1 ATP-dependent Clp protease adapter ClpS [Leucobacter denitrificans]
MGADESGTKRSPSTDGSLAVAPQLPWRVIVWDDPVNLMSYVSYVFRTHFGFTVERADELMLRVHNFGRAVVAEGSREAMELHVEAMHEYGLWATVEREDAQ